MKNIAYISGEAFVMQYKVVLTFESVLGWNLTIQCNESYWAELISCDVDKGSFNFGARECSPKWKLLSNSFIWHCVPNKIW